MKVRCIREYVDLCPSWPVATVIPEYGSIWTVVGLLAEQGGDKKYGD